MSPEVPTIKLPNSPFGYFLLLHTGLLFFWLYNRADSSISILLPLSISGIVVGWFRNYFVGGYLNNQLENGGNYSDIYNSANRWSIIAIILYILIFSILNSQMQPPISNQWIRP